jgi:hypothetical protein
MAYVRIPETAWRITKGSEVMYLTDLWFTRHLADKYVELVQAEPTREFYQFIADNMNAVLDGEQIADEIEPVVMNLIDDRMNNRPMSLRTGDYIVLQRAFMGKGR